MLDLQPIKADMLADKDMSKATWNNLSDLIAEVERLRTLMDEAHAMASEIMAENAAKMSPAPLAHE